jgi:ubiquinone/menaquinone biosynthesis C-methylase UbiE
MTSAHLEMNSEHLELLVSDGWRQLLDEFIMPWALQDIDLGDDVLEIGAGPGLTTDLLMTRVAKLTAVEINERLAGELSRRLASTNVEVVNADATAMPFESGRFTSAMSFTMLHHVPTVALQDALFREIARVLCAGGVFVAYDSVASESLAALHNNDTYNPVDALTIRERLTAAGFVDVEVRSNEIGWTATAHK